jgi:hypothetical protein
MRIVWSQQNSELLTGTAPLGAAAAGAAAGAAAAASPDFFPFPDMWSHNDTTPMSLCGLML